MVIDRGIGDNVRAFHEGVKWMGDKLLFGILFGRIKLNRFVI